MPGISTLFFSQKLGIFWRKPQWKHCKSNIFQTSFQPCRTLSKRNLQPATRLCILLYFSVSVRTRKRNPIGIFFFLILFFIYKVRIHTHVYARGNPTKVAGCGLRPDGVQPQLLKTQLCNPQLATRNLATCIVSATRPSRFKAIVFLFR